ncbi:AfsA-related hotdog domain-containing protein [Agrobacterium salinitolerans]|uniref:AfsA-related hotdog domain-containing protein n=1 Tax=Agrobacterium salinitolerans TaxID=1183413 RepID=A0A9X3KRH7_9HYPH|nr:MULTISPECIES: AfsA-related hotdog domain-containing protein [Agrobacterium]MCZ7853829.1 AfsA-related hotdog domain-containing protein [Agrobacterium salinitolerans]MCZ7891594.1 AfsA-related hotdog domain-containing protein [Agrobacterium salinitolerans]MCZ7939701.1 AfsA-related hotdog domain-containing protein [Agrobacterium salinitolerans]MCZ7976799.1 AfsA-related hotdog domain-containing protein [Agrobacterium salinitolerans]TRA89671.1 hypothetical protein EXN23_15380 [Agrobacterium salin
MTIFIVVPDQFSDFSNNCGVLSFSSACAMLKSRTCVADDIFIQGQGLSENEVISFEATAHLNDATKSLVFWAGNDRPKPATSKLTHKHRPENTLISTPLLIGTDHYRSHLILSAQNELLLDHVTGQHVQGMVLVEACRQMFIAVSELAYMGGEPRKSYVVFNQIAAKFVNFTFALPAQVEYRLVNLDDTRSDRIGISSALSVWQNGSVTTELNVAYTLFEPAMLKPKEIAKGKAAVAAYAATVEEALYPQALVG